MAVNVETLEKLERRITLTLALELKRRGAKRGISSACTHPPKATSAKAAKTSPRRAKGGKKEAKKAWTCFIPLF